MTTPTTPSGTIQDQATRWFVLNRQGTLAEAQRLAFVQWMQRSPEHVRAYLRVLHVHREVAAAMDVPRDAVGRRPVPRPAGSRKVVPLFANASRSVPRRRRFRVPWRAVAAAACIAMLPVLPHAILEPETQWLATAHGQLRDLTLSDGTRVQLNADSAVRAHLDLLRRRVEVVKGEATFDVAPQRRPFQARVGHLRLRDIGTVFDVSRRRQDTRVGVVSGRVDVWSDHGPRRRLARIDAGQVVLVDDRSLAVRAVDMPAAMLLDWQQRKVSFRHERLDEVASAFNRHNRVQVLVEDDAAAGTRLSGSLDAHRVAALQAFLERDRRLRVHRTADALHVRSR